jgi:hypothetical protein
VHVREEVVPSRYVGFRIEGLGLRVKG